MQTNRPSDVSSRKKREPTSKVSFARDIRPLFRAVDISHMQPHGVKLDDYTFMSKPDNANRILRALSPHDNHPPPMPPGGPYWTQDQLALFARWQRRLPGVSFVMRTMESDCKHHWPLGRRTDDHRWL